jgi:hypothetical protein
MSELASSQLIDSTAAQTARIPCTKFPNSATKPAQERISGVDFGLQL